jgi:ribosomal protein S18 acetylase RimI-like enzyme
MIEQATANDIAAIVNIIVEYRGEGKSTEERREMSAAAKQQLHACLADRDNHSVYVARDASDEVLGYLAVHWIPFPVLPGLEGYISDLNIASGARGQGLGKKLILAAEEEAKSKSATRLMLNNPKGGESYHRRFYAKLGFAERIDFANFVKELEHN